MTNNSAEIDTLEKHLDEKTQELAQIKTQLQLDNKNLIKQTQGLQTATTNRTELEKRIDQLTDELEAKTLLVCNIILSTNFYQLEKKTKELTSAHQDLYALKQEIEFYKIDKSHVPEYDINKTLEKV
jgi:chromosome segregation ATPase